MGADQESQTTSVPLYRSDITKNVSNENHFSILLFDADRQLSPGCFGFSKCGQLRTGRLLISLHVFNPVVMPEHLCS
jgi:hypothetical protein